jgi:hypothetical protein
MKASQELEYHSMLTNKVAAINTTLSDINAAIDVVAGKGDFPGQRFYLYTHFEQFFKPFANLSNFLSCFEDADKLLENLISDLAEALHERQKQDYWVNNIFETPFDNMKTALGCYHKLGVSNEFEIARIEELKNQMTHFTHTAMSFFYCYSPRCDFHAEFGDDWNYRIPMLKYEQKGALLAHGFLQHLRDITDQSNKLTDTDTVMSVMHDEMIRNIMPSINRNDPQAETRWPVLQYNVDRLFQLAETARSQLYDLQQALGKDNVIARTIDDLPSDVQNLIERLQLPHGFQKSTTSMALSWVKCGYEIEFIPDSRFASREHVRQYMVANGYPHIYADPDEEGAYDMEGDGVLMEDTSLPFHKDENGQELFSVEYASRPITDRATTRHYISVMDVFRDQAYVDGIGEFHIHADQQVFSLADLKAMAKRYAWQEKTIMQTLFTSDRQGMQNPYNTPFVEQVGKVHSVADEARNTLIFALLVDRAETKGDIQSLANAGNKYNGLSFMKGPTVEFRGMQSTLSSEIGMKTIDFFQDFLNRTKQRDGEHIDHHMLHTLEIASRYDQTVRIPTGWKCGYEEDRFNPCLPFGENERKQLLGYALDPAINDALHDAKVPDPTRRGHYSFKSDGPEDKYISPRLALSWYKTDHIEPKYSNERRLSS